MKFLILFTFILCSLFVNSQKYQHSIQATLVEITSKQGNRCSMKLLAGSDTIYYRYRGKMLVRIGDTYTISFNEKHKDFWLPSAIKRDEGLARN